MSNYIVDPNTGIKIPIVGVDPGEDYAVNISEALSKLSSLTHTGAANLDGLQIPTQGINIDEDLSAQSNNLTNLRSTRYEDQPSELVGLGDLNCVYFVDGDLWINNAAGTPVQITSDGSIISIPSNNYIVNSISTNHSINSTDTDTLFNCDCTVGAIIITLPIAADVQTGRLYVVKDEFGQSATYTITINPNGGDNIEGQGTYIIKDNYAAVAFIKLTSTRWGVFAYDKRTYQGEIINYNNSSYVNLDNTSTLNNEGTTTLSGTSTLSGTTTLTGPVTLTNTVHSAFLNISDLLTVNAITGIGGGPVPVDASITSPLYNLTYDVNETRTGRAGGAADPAAWVPDNLGIWTNAGLGLSMQFYFSIPNGAKITSIVVSYQAAAGHAGLPGVMPLIALKYYDTVSKLGITVASQSDLSPNAPAFMLQHDITLTPLTTVATTNTAIYHLGVTAESTGGNAAVGAKVYYYIINYTRLAGSKVGED